MTATITIVLLNFLTEYKPLNGVGQGTDVFVRSGEIQGLEAEASKKMQRAEGRGEEAGDERNAEVGKKVEWYVTIGRTSLLIPKSKG